MYTYLSIHICVYTHIYMYIFIEEMYVMSGMGFC